MRIIGITGTIGAGKSTVLRRLAELGARTLEADALVHQLYETDQELRARLQARFGPQVASGGRVDRPALTAAAFGSPQGLADLEAIVHPLVLRRRDAELAAARAAGVAVMAIEAIKLVESGGSARCDELWIVVAAREVQLARLLARGVDEAEAQRRLAHQGAVAGWSAAFLDESARLGRRRPIMIVDNSGRPEQTREQVHRLWHGLGPVARTRARGIGVGGAGRGE
jgi:dephospho-CoA kinase